MPRYAKETKDKIRALLDAGIPDTEVEEEEGIPRNTIWRWKKEWEKASQDTQATLANLKKQLSTLSRRSPTEAISRRIAMITKAVSALEGVEAKKKESAQKARKKLIIEVQTNESYEGYLKKVLDEKWLFKYQEDFLLDNSQFRITLKSRQIGFSYVSALDALLKATTGRNQLFLSASEEQALILMRYVDLWAQRLGIEFSKDSTHEKSLPNGAIIKALAHNFRTVQGFTGDVWMDEFAWYPNPKRIWHAFVPSIGAIKGSLTILSTPFEEASLFAQLWNDETKYYMFSRHRVDIYRAIEDGLAFDLQTMRALFDAETWASAYECQFIDDESAMFPIALIKSCVDVKLGYRTPPADTVLFGGYDIGRSKDRSSLAALELESLGAYRLSILEVIAKASFAAQETHISAFLNTYALGQIRIDRTGIGMQLAENMHTKFKNRAVGVAFTQTIKSVMTKNLKKLFEDKKIRIPNDPLLIADIHAIKRIAGAKDFIYDSIRNEHGHADRYWSLALAASHVEAIGITGKAKGKAWII